MPREARRDELASLLWPTADEPTPGGRPPEDDPFASLLESDEAEDVVMVPRDDAAAVRSLFGPPPKHVPATAEPRPGNWPGHNYGPAYDALRTQRRPMRRRALHERHEADVWDVDEAIAPPKPVLAAPPPPEPAVPEPWPTRTLAEARSWLDSLNDDVLPRATEAHLVSTLRGERPRVAPSVLFDVTEVLQARVLAPRRASATKRTADWTERVLRLAALGFLALFAGALLQLIFV